MASSALDAPESFADRFRTRLGDRTVLSFAAFMDLALYDPVCGYYRRQRERVARQAGADFYTAESFREVFSALIAASALNLLGGRSPADFSFVEVGAEPGAGLLPETLTAFRDFRVVRLGEEVAWPDRSVLFSNELYDAQPFHRIVHKAGQWVEAGVRLKEGRPVWQDLPALSEPVRRVAQRLPAEADEGWVIDLPLAATALLESQVSGDWEGVFLAADYGKTWTALTTDLPEGTGRAYRHHRQDKDLLANPGEQDLTCHLCWDWMEEVLRGHRFTGIGLESQEAFFMHRARGVIGEIIAGPAGPLSQARSQLKTLLHPGLMGQKFQILHGVRG